MRPASTSGSIDSTTPALTSAASTLHVSRRFGRRPLATISGTATSDARIAISGRRLGSAIGSTSGPRQPDRGGQRRLQDLRDEPRVAEAEHEHGHSENEHRREHRDLRVAGGGFRRRRRRGGVDALQQTEEVHRRQQARRADDRDQRPAARADRPEQKVPLAEEAVGRRQADHRDRGEREAREGPRHCASQPGVFGDRSAPRVQRDAARHEEEAALHRGVVQDVQHRTGERPGIREPDAEAHVDMMLSEYRKIDPGYWEEILFYDHPSGRNRVHMAMQWKAEHLDELK